MQQAAKRKNKVQQLFKLHPAMVANLKKESSKTGLTKTKILERALAEYFLIKR